MDSIRMHRLAMGPNRSSTNRRPLPSCTHQLSIYMKLPVYLLVYLLVYLSSCTFGCVPLVVPFGCTCWLCTFG